MSWHHLRQLMHLGDTWQLTLLTSSKTPRPRGQAMPQITEKTTQKSLQEGEQDKVGRTTVFRGGAKFGCEDCDQWDGSTGLVYMCLHTDGEQSASHNLRFKHIYPGGCWCTARVRERHPCSKPRRARLDRCLFSSTNSLILKESSTLFN